MELAGERRAGDRMSEFTPHTDDVRADYADRQMISPFFQGGQQEIEQGEAEFDRWLRRDRARERAEALEEAAVAARSMYDPPKAECVEWADWLDARAARVRSDAGIGGGPSAFRGEGDFTEFGGEAR